MRSLLLSRRDLDFLLHEWLDVGALTARERFAEHSRETFDAVLELSERVATEQFAPHNRTADLHEPEFDGERVHMIPEVAKALEAFAATGITAAGMDESVGGMQLPQTVAQACFLWFQAANVGTSAYPFLTIANANLLLAHGTPEQVETWVEPMLEGRYFGTMCLSEPQAGSSLADITTRAEPRDDGTYRLSGNKMWISGGDHDLSENIVHLVLAKVPGGPAGVKGISLFIVPKFLADGQRNDVSLAGVNHKMGFRGTVNTLLNFGEGRHTPGGEAGAVGYLVGEEGRGLALMFHMMNEARVGVGGNAAALGYTGYLHALDYARTRTQGRPPTAKSGPPVAIIEHPDVARMLLAQKSYAEGAVALILYCARLLDDERTGATEVDRARAHLLLDTLTPIAKSWPSQWCLAANDLAIQVHGGYGYTREYAVEQFWRDNRLNMIHEGTHGIQGLDLLGRKVVLHDGAGLRLLLDTITGTVDAARAAGLDDHADALAAAVARTGEVTAALWAAGDPAVTLANSSTYLEAVGHVVVAWMWLEQLVAAAGREGDFYDGKRAAGGYFFRHELPRTGPQFALLESLDRSTLDVRPEWF
ncbi:acyl-CoA dehydrogenase [Pseudonocardia broussonetiae]|uniref:Acyl-CoA dehydrogenase n=1 Tax=Pseudonocardia broussonetiae TaxID=2736640 RepID=A0A6M6JQU3_9PSEU|nr:acyl-CoA dehydrogenase [Pseudonocardia broussonetiae]QJY49583.1 acyl-CoA dehydrogenase [Pseudonocardia broussonetiae]